MIEISLSYKEILMFWEFLFG